MIGTIFAGIFLVACIIFIVWFKNHKKWSSIGGVDWSTQPQGSVATSDEKVQTTPKGARVLSKKGVSDKCLELVDLGLSDAFEAAVASGYTNQTPMEFGFYDILIPNIDCVPSPEQKIPSFLIRADNYDGTEFDQHNPKGVGVKDGIGVTFCAEMVVSLGTPGSSLLRGQMVCCSDESVVRDATRNGAEHIIIAFNDTDYYWETQTHTTKGHPLLPNIKTNTPQFRGFVANKSANIENFDFIANPVK